MSGTSSFGSFNKDKVANKFGIQLKPKDAPRRPSTSSTEKTTTESLNVTKNKTIGNFHKENNTNGFLSNTNRSTVAKTPEPTRKVPEKSSSTSKSTAGLLNTSVNNERTNSLTSNANHSTTKSREPSPLKSPMTTKRSSVITTQRAVSPAPPVKQPNAPTTTRKTEAQIEHQKNQPLSKRELTKPLDNTSSTPATTAPPTSSLKR